MRIRIFGALCVLLCGQWLVAETPPTTSPATGHPADHLPRGIEGVRDIDYIPGGGPAESLDVYFPANSRGKKLPLVIWIHGGAWRSGNKKGCLPLYLVPSGYAAASIEYRFSPVALFPAQIQDCQAAIRWLRAHSQTYHIDPDHIGVGGDSAGGHLVALVGTSGGKHAFPPIGGNENESDRVQAVCDFYGPADFGTVVEQAAEDKRAKNIFNFNGPGDPYSALIGAHLDPDSPKVLAVSPVHYVSKDNPPMLILHGTADKLVPYAQSVELSDALKAVGVPVLLQTFPGAGHGGPVFTRPASLKLIHNFFDKYLRGMDVTLEPIPEAEAATTLPAAK